MSSCTGVRVLAVSLQRPSRPSRPARPEHPQRTGASTLATPRDGFQPVWLAELELSERVPRVRTTVRAADASHRRARVLVRREGHPVGVVETDLDEGGLSQAEVARICADFDRRPAPARRRTGRTGLGLPGGLTATVVVATHNRSTGLGRCLDSLRAMDCPTPPIVVVDNAPASTAAADLLRRDYPEVTYLREEVAGLARAHNRGLALVETPVVAFTDDDVVVDRDWLPSLVAPFAEDEEVGCVTGLIWPAELDTPAQVLIDAKGGFAKGFERRRFHRVTARPDDPLFPYTAGRFGSGANMAFRTTALRALGGFDPALGAGSHGRGGDDLAAFFDVVTQGHALVYEPAAIVHHHHAREYAAVRAQAFNYGVGLGAYLTRVGVRRPATLVDFARLGPRAVGHLLGGHGEAERCRDRTGELLRLQLLGLASGPWAYLRGRHAAHRVAKGR